MTLKHNFTLENIKPFQKKVLIHRICLFQLLKAWHKDPSTANYDLTDLIEELQIWVDEGFVETEIWSTLEKRLNPTLLPISTGKVKQMKEAQQCATQDQGESQTTASFAQV